MSGFVFSLQPVLNYRKNRRDLCRQLLAQILADDSKLITHREALASERAVQFDEIRRLSERGPVAVDGAAMRRYHSGRLLAEIRGVDQKRQLVAQQIRLCRDVLAKADGEVKVLERLHDKQLATYRDEEERRAQREREDAWSARRVLETV